MDDPRQVLSKHLPQLILNFPLNKALDDGNRIKRRRHLHSLEWVRLEDERTALLLGEHEYYVRIEAKLRKTEEHGDDERLVRSEDSTAAPTPTTQQGRNARITIRGRRSRAVCKRVGLDFGPQDDKGVTGIRQLEDASKLVLCQFTNVFNLEFGRL